MISRYQEKTDSTEFVIQVESFGTKLGIVLENTKEMKYEKCTGEARINSHNELWCTNCAMLIHACKCQLPKSFDYRITKSKGDETK
jgi:hypothetical protein